MEKKLEKLFDYQKFENDSELNNMINSVLEDGVELADDDLSMVNAAGEPNIGVLAESSEIKKEIDKKTK